MTTHDEIVATVSAYYEGLLAEFGATARGVDWRDGESQDLRFRQFMPLLAGHPEASVLDFGCGYGEFLRFLRRSGHSGRYVGVDSASAMVECARTLHESDEHATFVETLAGRGVCDFAVASGVLNVRLGFTVEAWAPYALTVLDDLDRAGRLGFAFNCLTSYSDPDRMRPDLYYADPGCYFDLCKRRYARNVALLHDYDLYEFTIIVRKAHGESLSQ